MLYLSILIITKYFIADNLNACLIRRDMTEDGLKSFIFCP